MPQRPSRQCPGRGPYLHRCPNLVKGNDSYCPACSEYLKKESRQHNKEYDKDRNQSPERKFIHSRGWRKMRARKLAQDPLCEVCLREGRDTMAVLVDHVDGNELNNESENHCSMCNYHHELKHKKDRFGGHN